MNTMNRYVDNERLTPSGSQLMRILDQHIAAKTGMTEELRHYATAVYRTRLLKPTQWFMQFPEKADALWQHFVEPIDMEEDTGSPPRYGVQPWIKHVTRNK